MHRATIALLTVILLLASAAAEARTRAAHHPLPPDIRHIFLVIMENQDADRVLQKPFVARLAAEGGLLANYHCIGHPSQPNYIALAAGSTWGVTDDATADLDVPHLGDLLDQRSLPWKVYAERYPGGCFLGHNADGGLYVRRHVPFLGFANMQKNTQRCAAHVVNATALDADIAARTLPAFAMYIPDQNHNGHDTSLDTADAWLESKFGPLLRDPRFTDHTLFVLTYDESEHTGTTQVTTVFWGAGVKRGTSTAHYYDHYDLLRTIENLLALPTLDQEDRKQGEAITEILNAVQ
ncbi:MAG TPA: alkaline phosphatase family protein [Thermoanaerobaculia bacterium]|nr:alkaline phosphatase family protein [Thermoanaerobaculia bacterium]